MSETSKQSSMPPIPPTLEKRVQRLELAVETMASWLVAAQTGFGHRDAEGIWGILRGERDESNQDSESA